MAGVKGKSGGQRPGAGRKPKPAAAAPAEMTPLEFLVAAMLGKVNASPTQVRAATAAAQYMHIRKADGGKKDEQAEKAKTAASGKFAPAAAPLKLVGRR